MKTTPSKEQLIKWIVRSIVEEIPNVFVCTKHISLMGPIMTQVIKQIIPAKDVSAFLITRRFNIGKTTVRWITDRQRNNTETFEGYSEFELLEFC